MVGRFNSFLVAGPVGQGGGPLLLEANVFAPNPPIYPSAYYIAGTGNPAVSTADYYLMNGIYWLQCYDLAAMGSDGATIQTREGNRYVWMIGPDHPNSANFQGSSHFRVGYSNDPQILPDPGTLRTLLRYNTLITTGGQTGFTLYQAPYLVYNPDSAGDKFWIYAEGLPSSPSRQHELGLFTTSDFLTSTLVGPVIQNAANGGWSSLGRVYRTGVNTWYAISLTDPNNFLNYGYYTSTDGLAWTLQYSLTPQDALHNISVNGSFIGLGSADNITYASQEYALAREQTNGNVAPSVSYATLVPVDSGFNLLTSPAAIRLTSSHSNLYPGPTFLQNIGLYKEDGIAHINVTRGFPTSGTQFSLQSGTYAQGGGLWQQFLDRYAFIYDATTAADAAPSGVKASCTSGVVTLSWDNIVTGATYRIYKGSSSGTQTTLVGDVTGTSTTHSPTTGQQWWFKVVKLNAGVEKSSRVVHCYVSSAILAVNKHINRVIDDGGDATKIDATFLTSVDSYLTTNNYHRYLLHWADARFGVKLDGSGFVSKVYDFGTTRLPRGGDFTPTTSNTFPSTSSNTSYSATSFRGTTPSWVNNAGTAHGYFGNGIGNNIQRKVELTVIAAYQKPGTLKSTLIAMGEVSTAYTGMYLVHGSGTPGTVSVGLSDRPTSTSTFTTATIASSSATAAHVIAGVFDQVNLTCYSDGVAGTPVSATALANPDLTNDTALRGHYAQTASQGPFLGSGSQDSKINHTTGAYTFSNNEALFTCAALIVFEKGLPAQAITDIGALYA